MTRRTPLTHDQADAIYTALVAHAGASEDDRRFFVEAQTDDYHYEYRFIGGLGFGGKFWRNDGRWYVSAYPEDVRVRPSRQQAINNTNAALSALLASETALAEATG